MLTLIVAMTPERVIGKDNDIPWHISEDLKLFRRMTVGNSVIMGRKTYDSLPMDGGLPNRKNYVITRSEYPHKFEIPNNVCYSHDLVSLLKAFKGVSDEVFVIGGATIYEQALPYVDKLSISFVNGEYTGDTFFPEFDFNDWDVIDKTEYDEFTHMIFERKVLTS